MSISALTRFSNCALLFFANDCIIQDTSRAVQIGKDRRVGNLHYMTIYDMQVHYTCFSDSIVPSNETLWHFRLGHPSCVKNHPLNKDLLFGSYFNGFVLEAI